MQRYGLAKNNSNVQTAPSPPKEVWRNEAATNQPPADDPLAKYENFMKNLKSQFQVE